MPTLTIENAPEETLRALEAMAEHTHTTVSAVALKYLPKVVPMSADERVALRQKVQELSAAASSVGDSTTLIRRDRDHVSRNELSPGEALALSRKLRAKAARPVYPDSTPGLRGDRDAR